MSEFQGTYVCKVTHDLKPIEKNWEFVENESSVTLKFPVSEQAMKDLLDGKNPVVSFFCKQCDKTHEVRLEAITVEKLKGGDTDEQAVGDV